MLLRKHLKNVLTILNDLPDFKPIHLSSLLLKLAAKKETQRMGIKIFDGLTQKIMARLIRNLLLEINQSKWDKKNSGLTITYIYH